MCNLHPFWGSFYSGAVGNLEVKKCRDVSIGRVKAYQGLRTTAADFQVLFLEPIDTFTN